MSAISAGDAFSAQRAANFGAFDGAPFFLAVSQDYDTITLEPRGMGRQDLDRRDEARSFARDTEESIMGVDSAALIKTLNTTCVNALQAAAGLCLSRTNPSVEVEHWLVKLVEAPNTDLTRIFRHFEVDTSRLLRDLTKVIDQFRTGNQRTPTLSLRIDKLIREAWVLASIQFRASKVRSGVLLLALLEDEELGRLARDASRELAKIETDGAQGQPDEAGGRLGEDEGPAAADTAAGGEPGSAAGPAGVTQTPGLDQFTVNLTERAKKGEIDP